MLVPDNFGQNSTFALFRFSESTGVCGLSTDTGQYLHREIESATVNESSTNILYTLRNTYNSHNLKYISKHYDKYCSVAPSM